MRLFTMTIFAITLIIPGLACAGKVHEYRLKNGLQLLVKENHRAPVVISEIWYKVGSSYEPNGITGISHALEHMMFRGTKRYGPGKFAQIVEENGGMENAFTSYDYTGYFEILAADKLPIAFTLEADRMRHLLLSKKAFEKEIQVVMEERRMRTDDSPQGRTYERFAAAAFLSNPYHHSPIGWMNDLQNMRVQDLRKWYKTWYAPNNAILVVVGDLNPKRVYQLAKKTFGRLKPEHIPTMKPRKNSPPLGERFVEVKAPAKLPWLVMGYNVPVLKTAKQRWETYALYVAAGILSGGESARLPKELVRKQQIAAAANADYSLYSLHDDLFRLTGTPTHGHTVYQLKRALLSEIRRLQTNLVSQSELDRIKAQVIAANVYKKDSLSAQAQEIGSLEASGLSWRDAEAFVQRIKAVTAEQVRDVARKYLVSDRLTVAILKPLPLPNNVVPPSSAPGGRDVR